ncbi:MAG: dephospho-CoA kinase [Coriobacteriia bacterium]|nr:dephospho-CoA kinase [Coriobacteriia bacterium]
MYVVFLTGGLASGKSTVADILAEKGAILLDLDQIAKEEQESDEVKQQLQDAFGQDIVGEDGELNRRLLAERAFSSAEATQQLNDICWPPTISRLETYIATGKVDPSQQSTLVVVQVPLLVEAPVLIPLADEVIAVSAATEARLERAVQRGMDRQDAENRLARQVSDQEREKIADTVFDNSGDLDDLRQMVYEWYNQLEFAG